MSLINKITKFIKEVRAEMEKVKWPSREEALRLTLVVIVVSTVLGVYIGAIDFGLTKVIEKFLRWFPYV